MVNRKSISTIFLIIFLVGCLLILSCKKTPDDSSAEQSEPAKSVEVKNIEVESKTSEPEKPAATESQTGLVAIEIVLPKPMFVGTPQNFRVSNLERPLGKPRPAFYAPAGTINVAAGKSVASTDEEPIIGEIEMITDGDKEAADGSYVELAPFVQHVTIDLGDRYNIYAILVWHYHKQARVYHDVVVQVADDPDFVTNVKTIFNTDDDNSAGLGIGTDNNYVETAEGKLIDAKGVQGRYVRLYSNGNTSNELNHYIEVEVFGKAAK